jgi:hypothetical protein
MNKTARYLSEKTWFTFRLVFFVQVVMILLFVSACASLPRGKAVPFEAEHRAGVPGLREIRYVVGNKQDMERLAADVADTWTRERKWLNQQGKSARVLPLSNILALSGGGDKGAFGAGLLNGWSEHGSRPEFLLVTGISTGGLIAPFAFLGQKYDKVMKNFYTNTKRSDIVKERNLLAILNTDAMADTKPLRKLIETAIDENFINEVAAEYLKGRELWISTTNLDSRKTVIWNMTKIAAIKNPKALELFRDVMIASAAIPAAFPPVMIDVEVDGKIHSEMHVDGGAMSQVFVYPPDIDLGELSEEGKGVRKRNLFVVMNARLDPEWAQTERKVLPIAGRAISSMIQTQGIGDLYRIYITSVRDGVQFNMAFIPEDFKHPRREDFDTEFMRALYKTGYEMALKGYPWHHTPPGFDATVHTLPKEATGVSK